MRVVFDPELVEAEVDHKHTLRLHYFYRKALSRHTPEQISDRCLPRYPEEPQSAKLIALLEEAVWLQGEAKRPKPVETTEQGRTLRSAHWQSIEQATAAGKRKEYFLQNYKPRWPPLSPELLVAPPFTPAPQEPFLSEDLSEDDINPENGSDSNSDSNSASENNSSLVAHSPFGPCNPSLFGDTSKFHKAAPYPVSYRTCIQPSQQGYAHSGRSSSANFESEANIYSNTRSEVDYEPQVNIYNNTKTKIDINIDPTMGVIRKKTATRGAEGGVKFVCDVCSADITSTVRVKCTICSDYDLCVPCFSDGKFSQNHNPATHPYRLVEQNSVPIYDKDWGADEEALLLEGAEIYGLGSWADIADHIGGYRDKDEVREHYDKIYLQSSKFPLPERADPKDMSLLEEMPREEFQARKKARIEQRKEKAKNAPPATPKTKPTASVPSCHEVQGYMPGRLEFETEYQNEAEEAVQLMQFEPGDGINAVTGKVEAEMDLKMTVMGVYNDRLTQRAERKKVIFEHGLLEYRKNAAIDKKRTKEERDIVNKTKPFARIMNRDDYEEFSQGLLDEHNLRTAIIQLQEWRNMGLTSLDEGEKYEKEKALRAQKQIPMGSLDRERYASSQRQKAAPIVETPSGAAAFVAPGEMQLPERLKEALDIQTDGTTPHAKVKVAANGHANGTLTPQSLKLKSVVPALSGVTPLSLAGQNIADLHLLTSEEIDLCEKCRMYPKPYLVIKEAIMKEALKGDGKLKKKLVKEICGLDSQKGGRIFDFFVTHGWIGKA